MWLCSRALPLPNDSVLGLVAYSVSIVFVHSYIETSDGASVHSQWLFCFLPWVVHDTQQSIQV